MSRMGTTQDETAAQDPTLHSRDFSVSNSIDDDLAGSSGSAKGGLLAQNGGMIVLLIVVAVAAALLMGMRKLGLAGRLELVDIKIDYPFEAEKGTVVGPNHQSVINDLRRSADVVQVPPEQVQMNPFEWKTADEKPAARDDLAVAEAERLRRQAEARRREVDSAFSRLRLNSVMGGRIPVAQISGVLVREGDTVDELFRVKAIEGRSVTLTVDGREYTLTLGD